MPSKYEIVREARDRNVAFSGTIKGVPYRFRVVEHVNIGKGWMIQELSGRIGRIVGEEEIDDIVIPAESK